MFLKLIYITNIPSVALIAEKNGVDRIMVDLEILGKEERQRNMNTVKSYHTIEDVRAISSVLTSSELLVRVNPWNENSVDEIEAVIASGADRIMLPMWKTVDEASSFLGLVNGRVHTTLLLETKEAVDILDEILKHPQIDEIYIGLNDLHLSYGLTFMFELLSNGVVERICQKCKQSGIPYGFGGVAKIGEGLLPAESIVMEHYRLGSSRVILSRSFCNTEEITDLATIEAVFFDNLILLREFERSLANISDRDYSENVKNVKHRVEMIVDKIKEKRRSE